MYVIMYAVPVGVGSSWRSHVIRKPLILTISGMLKATSTINVSVTIMSELYVVIYSCKSLGEFLWIGLVFTFRSQLCGDIYSEWVG